MWLEITQKSKKHHLALSSDLALNENDGRSAWHRLYPLYAVSRGRVKNLIVKVHKKSVSEFNLWLKFEPRSRICLRGCVRRNIGRSVCRSVGKSVGNQEGNVMGQRKKKKINKLTKCAAEKKQTKTTKQNNKTKDLCNYIYLKRMANKRN